MEGVNDRLLDHCQDSSVLHYCVFKEQEIPRMYTVGHLLKLKCKYSNILDTGFLLSLAVSSNHQNENKNTFEMFYFTFNETKIYESFSF